MYKPKYKTALVFSLFVHAVIFGVLLANLKFEPAIKVNYKNKPSPKPIVQASAISEEKVLAEIKRLDEIEVKKKQEEINRKQELERIAKQHKLEQEKLAKLKQEQKKKAQAAKQEEARLAALKKKQEQEIKKAKEEAIKHKKELERIAKERQLQEELAKAEEETFIQSEVSRYAAIINNKISENWLRPASLANNLSCIVQVKLTESGEVVSSNLVQSSGDAAFDRSTEIAIRKASPLPLPSQSKAKQKFMDFTFTFKPEAA